jgi:hypothetical protein
MGRSTLLDSQIESVARIIISRFKFAGIAGGKELPPVKRSSRRPSGLRNRV